MSETNSKNLAIFFSSLCLSGRSSFFEPNNEVEIYVYNHNLMKDETKKNVFTFIFVSFLLNNFGCLTVFGHLWNGVV